MTSVIRGELATLVRRRVLVAAGVATTVFVVVTVLSVFLSAEPAAGPLAQERTATLESLADSGGGTEAFSRGIGFFGLFVLVAFVARFAGEFSHGTLRTLLMKEPRRLRLVLGKMVALLAFMAATLLVAEALTFIASVSIAPGQHVDTAAWYSLDGLGGAAGDYAVALVGAAAWGLYGMTLGLLLRSMPIAIGVAIAWAGPLENITAQSWQATARWFPGLQLQALAAGGISDVSSQRALLLTAIYVSMALAVGLLTLHRRDISG